LPGINLVHVKGHQDEVKPYDSLPLLAQLNVDADKMASRYQDEHGMSRPFALMASHTGAHLVHRSGTITSKYEERIRVLATSPPLREKIRSKYSWSETTMRMINWNAHGKVCRAHRTSKVHTSKLIHDCLPTHSFLNKFDTGNRPCPKCKHITEDRDHILRCPHPTRQQWRTTLMNAITQFHCNMATSPLLRHVLSEALQQWFHLDSPDVISPILFPQDVRRLIHQQNEIGWRQLFNGRFSGEWVRLQDDYYYNHRRHTKYRRTGAQWQQRLITLIWSQWRQLWSLRNNDVHGNTAREKTAAEHTTMARQLSAIYDRRQHLEGPVQRLLHEDINIHLQRPLRVTQNWLAMTAPLIRDSLRRTRDQSRQGVRSIRSYFRPESIT
jgi:hypothetical protein